MKALTQKKKKKIKLCNQNLYISEEEERLKEHRKFSNDYCHRKNKNFKLLNAFQVISRIRLVGTPITLNINAKIKYK